jgi:anti-anti-sigma factor
VKFSVQKNDSHTCIRLQSKKLNASMAPELKSGLVVLIENGEKNILMDLTGCDSCDSSGLSVFLLGNRLCSGINGKFVLCGVSGQIREMINVVGFDSVLMITGSKEQAEELFS